MSPPLPPETPQRQPQAIDPTSPSAASTGSSSTNQKVDSLSEYLQKRKQSDEIRRSIGRLYRNIRDVAECQAEVEQINSRDEDAHVAKSSMRSHFLSLARAHNIARIELEYLVGMLSEEIAQTRGAEAPAWLRKRLRGSNRIESTVPEINASIDTLARSTEPPERPEIYAVELICQSYRLEQEPQVLPENVFLASQLAEQFQVHYQGEDHIEFDQRVAAIDADVYNASFYARDIALTQSSGTGKSRLMREVSTIQPTFSLCLRPRGSQASSGFPLCDAFIADFLQSKEARAGLTPVHVLASLFAAIFERLESRLGDRGDFDFFADLDVTSQGDARADFMLDVTSSAKATLQSLPTLIGSIDATEVLRKVVLPSASRFFKKLSKLQWKHKADRFYFVLDECSNLEKLSEAKENPQKITLQHLRSLIAAFDRLDDQERLPFKIWCVLLDTSISVWNIGPALSDMTSARAGEAENRVPPYVLLAFDRLLTSYKGPSSAGEAYSVEHLKMFGRPLWGVMPNNNVVLDLAGYKLFLGIKAATTLREQAEQQPYALLAMLGHRVCLDLIPVRATSVGGKTVSNMIARHMRCLTSVAEDTTIVTEARSEPVLSIAAMQRLFAVANDFAQGYTAMLQQFLARLAIGTSVDYTGERGEFVCRLLIIMALDHTLGAAGIDELSSLKAALTPTSVDAFMATLLGSKRWKELRPRLAASSKVDLAQCWIHATHVTALAAHWKGDVEKTLSLAWLRSTALQCPPTEPGIDGVIPVYTGDLSRAFDPKAITYIAWQAKLTASAQGKAALSSCMHGPTKHHTALGAQAGLFTLLFDLGASPARTKEACTLAQTCCTMPDPDKQPSAKARKRKASGDSAASREAAAVCPLQGQSHDILHLRGISTDSMPFLNDENASLVRQLVRPREPTSFWGTKIENNETPFRHATERAYGSIRCSRFDHLLDPSSSLASTSTASTEPRSTV